jgi:CHAT domain-containing protein
LYSTGSSQCKGEELYELVWSKVEKEIKGCRAIYYSPAGILNAVSLQAISNGKSYLGEKYTMHLVSSIGSVPQIKAETAEIGAKAVVYGGIQYDVEESMMIQESRSYMPTNTLTWDTSFGETRRGWKYLPGTDKEAKSISSMFTNHNIDVKLISGTSAHEESFKALSGKHNNILHIGTHGFTWTDSVAKKQDFFAQRVQLMGQEQYYDTSIDPLNRCGLLFAGANIALQGNSKNLPEGVQDGILTAKEISLMDLRDANLVVLSACETAKGDITSEGVFGLQRAFKMAGVQTIIMSLWKVNDQATQILMTEFYNNWIGKKQSKREAFRNAQNSVRYAKDKDGDYKYNKPIYWAGFIMLD